MNAVIVVGDRGQDGTLLSESLQKKGYLVVGVARKGVHVYGEDLPRSNCDITDRQQVFDLVKQYLPCMVYYLAAYHSSSEGIRKAVDIQNEYERSHQTHVVGLLNYLSAIDEYCSESKLFFASSSLVFSGQNGEVQDEKTALDPQGVYGITKAQGMWLCREFRQRGNLFASTGILYNHESALRSTQYLTTKVIHSAIRISRGSDEVLELGDLSSRVDWGHAAEYVEAFQAILSLDIADDYIVATGSAHTVREFVDITFEYFNLDPTKYIRVNSQLLGRRPLVKIGNPEKLITLTGWRPSKGFKNFVIRLVEEHLEHFH
jgi:GDPmannose 4,6-dehydratase